MIRKFNVTEGELYALCLSGWETCGRHIEKMNSFSPLYTADYVKARREEVSSTMAGFDRKQRRAELFKLRSDLNLQGKAALGHWRSLKLYIETAFAGEKLEAFMIEAGQPRYRLAQRKQWEEALKLLQAGQAFIEKHSEALLANQNMPAAFPAQYAAALQAYHKVHDAYMAEGIATRERTGTYVQILNKLYEDLLRMFAAGREVFKDNKPVLEQFRLRTGLDMISGTGWAGIKGKVYDEQGKQRLIPGLLIRLPETDDELLQEADGSFVLNHLAAGTYTLEVEAEGYQAWSQTVIVKLDTYSSVEVRLQSAAAPIDPIDEITVLKE